MAALFIGCLSGSPPQLALTCKNADLTAETVRGTAGGSPLVSRLISPSCDRWQRLALQCIFTPASHMGDWATRMFPKASCAFMKSMIGRWRNSGKCCNGYRPKQDCSRAPLSTLEASRCTSIFASVSRWTLRGGRF